MKNGKINNNKLANIPLIRQKSEKEESSIKTGNSIESTFDLISQSKKSIDSELES